LINGISSGLPVAIAATSAIAVIGLLAMFSTTSPTVEATVSTASPTAPATEQTASEIASTTPPILSP
jgi:hypothetical protein